MHVKLLDGPTGELSAAIFVCPTPWVKVPCPLVPLNEGRIGPIETSSALSLSSSPLAAGCPTLRPPSSASRQTIPGALACDLWCLGMRSLVPWPMIPGVLPYNPWCLALVSPMSLWRALCRCSSVQEPWRSCPPGAMCLAPTVPCAWPPDAMCLQPSAGPHRASRLHGACLLPIVHGCAPCVVLFACAHV